jgi:hypothetical protein
MIRCSNCASSNLTGAVFCTECGALLQTPARFAASDGAPASMQGSAFPMAARGQPAAPAGDDWAILHFLDTGNALPLRGRDEFTMGRTTERQPIPPDIDLSAYNAFSSGVSRRHATIRRRGSRVVVLDLDSANGTYVNGKRLGPRQEEPLANGDVIALGKLKIQIRLKTA